MHLHPRTALGAAAALLAATAISACGSSSTTTHAAAPAATSASPATTGTASTAATASAASSATNVPGADLHANHGAGKGPTLLVYSAQGYDINTVKAFSAATGVPTELVDDSTGPLLARIQAEKADPQWGLLWVDGATAFASLDQQGLLRKGLQVPPLNAAGEKVVPSDHSFVPTGITMGCTAIYNAKLLPNPPKTWAGLLSASLKGKVGMNDPAVSGPTYPCVAGIMQMMGGVSAGESYLKKLKANGLHVSQTNGDTLHLLTTGQIALGLIQSSAAIGAAATTPGLKVDFLPDLTVLPSAIGVDAKAPAAVQAEAQKFISYVLSPAGQHQMQTGDPTGDSLYWPVAPNTAPKSELPAFSSLSSQTINPYTWGAREAAINGWFTNNIAQ
ncbi:ABC transporter substrate-binding protein [Conexibacter sp. DBS9H8]|uniref:ABC transporter substrate-binding protein n=1 Tax=Conexibacter sp. DBS9H8 TaxID=2937801 RepID=UPI00200C5B88|nr:extracellular solute-binding protein [Conexibacter sp. DBS9H8]